jgi:hypothetical protein
MKTRLLIFMAAGLLTVGSFVACNQSNDDDLASDEMPGGIEPVIPEGKAGEELSAKFF